MAMRFAAKLPPLKAGEKSLQVKYAWLPETTDCGCTVWLDYYAVGKSRSSTLEEVLNGIPRGTRRTGSLCIKCVEKMHEKPFNDFVCGEEEKGVYVYMPERARNKFDL